MQTSETSAIPSTSRSNNNINNNSYSFNTGYISYNNNYLGFDSSFLLSSKEISTTTTTLPTTASTTTTTTTTSTSIFSTNSTNSYMNNLTLATTTTTSNAYFNSFNASDKNANDNHEIKYFNNENNSENLNTLKLDRTSSVLNNNNNNSDNLNLNIINNKPRLNSSFNLNNYENDYNPSNINKKKFKLFNVSEEFSSNTENADVLNNKNEDIHVEVEVTDKSGVTVSSLDSILNKNSNKIDDKGIDDSMLEADLTSTKKNESKEMKINNLFVDQYHDQVYPHAPLISTGTSTVSTRANSSAKLVSNATSAKNQSSSGLKLKQNIDLENTNNKPTIIYSNSNAKNKYKALKGKFKHR